MGSVRSSGDDSSSEAIQPSLIYTTLYKSPLAGPTTIFTASLTHGEQYGVAYLDGITFRDDPRLIKLSDLSLRVKEKFLYEYDFNDQRAGYRTPTVRQSLDEEHNLHIWEKLCLMESSFSRRFCAGAHI